MNTCEWQLDEDTDTWQTGCGEPFVFEAGGPKENEFNYCPHCAKNLIVEEGE